MSKIYPLCSCAGRSFWEGACDWCIANPPPREALTLEDFGRSVRIEVRSVVDDIISKAAVELGWRAGLSLSGFDDPSQRFENGGGI